MMLPLKSGTFKDSATPQTRKPNEMYGDDMPYYWARHLVDLALLCIFAGGGHRMKIDLQVKNTRRIASQNNNWPLQATADKTATSRSIAMPLDDLLSMKCSRDYSVEPPIMFDCNRSYIRSVQPFSPSDTIRASFLCRLCGQRWADVASLVGGLIAVRSGGMTQS